MANQDERLTESAPEKQLGWGRQGSAGGPGRGPPPRDKDDHFLRTSSTRLGSTMFSVLTDLS